MNMPINKTILSAGVNILSLTCLLLSLSQCGASERFSDNPTAEKFYQKGTTFLQQGFYDRAIPPLTEAIQNDEHFVAAFINRSLCRNKLKDYKEALQDAQSALRWNPESSYAWFQKGQAEQGLHEYIDAAKDYRNAAQYEPEAAYRYNELAAICFESAGQKGKAKELRANQEAASDINSLISRGLFKYEKGLYSEAINDFTAAIAQDSKSLQAYYNRGLCEATLGQYQLALADYGQALKLDPEYGQAYYLRGWDKFYLGDYNGSAEDFRKHVGMNDMGEAHSPYSVILSSFAYRRANRPDAAEYMLKWWKEYEYEKWPVQVIRFLRHENTVADVLSAANNNDLMTEAKAYIGMEYSLEGKINEAEENLKWVEVNGNRRFSEYQLALSELAKLAKSK